MWLSYLRGCYRDAAKYPMKQKTVPPVLPRRVWPLSLHRSGLHRGKESSLHPLMARRLRLRGFSLISVQFNSVAQSCPTLCNLMDCSTPSFPVHHNSWSLPKLMSIESVMPSNHLILCHPLLLLPSIFPSIRVFSNELVLCIRWSKYWSFIFSINPSNEYSGLISFRMHWLYLFAVQGTLKCLLQHHSSKESILWCSAFFIIQLSHPYKTTGKTIALTTWTFDDKVMSAF